MKYFGLDVSELNGTLDYSKLKADGVQFVNDFLKTIEEDGTWAKLWQISLGDRTGIDTAPEAPAIGE